MKRLLSLFVLLPSISFCQSYASFEGSLYNTDAQEQGWGIDFTGGAFLKNETDKNKASFMIGAGAGIYSFTKNDPYIPVFFQGGYCNPEKTISPYFNVRVGYAFYQGMATFIGKNESVKGGLYGNARAGASFKVSKIFHPTAFVGMTLITLRKVVNREVKDTYSQGLFNFGISILFRGNRASRLK